VSNVDGAMTPLRGVVDFSFCVIYFTAVEKAAAAKSVD